METETIRNTMQGFVSAEKQKFERLATKMKTKEKDLAIKNEKLRQVEELIKNSPCVVGKPTARYPLRDKNESHSCDETVCTMGEVKPVFEQFPPSLPLSAPSLKPKL